MNSAGRSCIEGGLALRYQVCTNCVMDNTDEDIVFDEHGVCMRCNEYKERILPEWNHGEGHEAELEALLADIKRKGETNQYDCILGLSGGLDSTYLLHLAVSKWGLRPFVFHVDAGWDLPVAVNNIQRVTEKLGVDLHIEKMDWDEMREMQLAWFRTGLEGLDAPQDHAFIALVDKYARELGVKYILNGYNIQTEIIANPASWGKDGGPTGDGTYMRDVIRKYCNVPIENYEFTSGFRHKFVTPYVLGVKTVTPLNYVPFTRKQMIETLAEEYGYEPYGQKHFEDLLTKFLEGWWAPARFGHDIRRAQLSSLVVNGEITRDEALRTLEETPLTDEEAKRLFKEVASRLQVSEEELIEFYELPYCTEHFRSQQGLYDLGIRLYERLGLEKRIRR